MIEPMLFPAILANAAASRTAVLLGLRLLNESIAGSFPGGESALACACDFLASHGRGALLAGGVWAGVSRSIFSQASGSGDSRMPLRS